MMKKLISIVLALVMCLGMVSMLFVTSGAEGTAPTLKIKAFNLSFQNSVAIKYAVDSSVENVKLLIWTEPTDDYVLGTQAKEIVSSGVSNEEAVKGCYIFDYTDLVAKQMTDVVYARACAEVDGVVYYSELVKYSILEYAYRKLGKIGSKPTTNENLKEMLSAMLEYGAGAQKYLDYSADRLATANWVLVELAAGLIDDGSAHGLYLPGDTVALTAPATRANGTTFDHWEDGAGNVVSTTASFELTVGTTNEVYTPVYYSLGLEYDEYGYVVGVGSWSGTTLAIPPVAPDGSAVVGIDTTDFQGLAITSLSLPSTLKEIASNGTFKGCAALTSVSIAAGLPAIPSSTFQDCTALEYVILPNTLTQIGRSAFSGCTKPLDVYYDGTEEQWNTNVTISSGNDPILNATKHFSATIVETFTVTFVDFDGTVLKTETVESGKSATAPADPTRTYYTFNGWDVAFDNVTSDLTVTATYTPVPFVVVNDAIANVGDTTVDVVISIENNPGIASLLLHVTPVDGLTLKNYELGLDFVAGFFTGPQVDTVNGGYKSQTFNWASASNVATDATFVTLTFEIEDTITVDTEFDVEIVLEGIFDAAEFPVSFEALAGRVIIQR